MPDTRLICAVCALLGPGGTAPRVLPAGWNVILIGVDGGGIHRLCFCPEHAPHRLEDVETTADPVKPS